MAYEDIISGLSGMSGNFFLVLYIGFIVVFFALIIVFFVWRRTFNIKTRIRYLTNSYDQIKDTKGKIVLDKQDGIEKFQYFINLVKRKNYVCPPSAAISLDMQGRKCVELEVGTDGISSRWIVKEKSSLRYVPFNSNDRVFLVNEEEKRISRKKKGIAELIEKAIPYLILVIILGLLLSFWQDVVAPFQQAGETNLAIAKEQKEITMLLKEMIRNEQIITGEIPLVTSEPPPE